MIRYEEYRGEEILPLVETLSRFRIEIFREYPYLYDGVMEQEMEHMREQSSVASAYTAVVYDDERAVGAVTCSALADSDGEVLNAFREAGVEVERYCYISEMLIEGEYRDRGIGFRLLALAERYADSIGRSQIAFCTVDRPTDHPLRPEIYHDVAIQHRRRGYTQHPTIKVEYAWREVGSSEERSNSLSIWYR